MKLTFLGAAETVTGSKYLLEIKKKKILIDCGLFQGRKELRLQNWDAPPVNPHELDAIILTHAHLDHSGYIPRMVRAGFRGRIYCSNATLDLCEILLPDSGYIQEEDAARANRYGYTKHNPALPLYTEQEAKACLKFFKPVAFGQAHKIGDDISFTLHRAGHILGASFVRITDHERSILFSGDVGRLHSPIMKPPEKIQSADYLVVESTYGDRLHSTDNPTEDIGRVIRETAARGGTIVIPAFAVGRAQEIMYHLYVLKSKKQIPNIPIYLDSPMAINATALLRKHTSDHRLSLEECEDVCDVVKYMPSVEDSKSLNHSPMPKIIISASGMATGGRVLHHLKHYLGDERSTILFAGYQAVGTRGDRLVKGEREIKIHGQMWSVQARIENLENMSAHADYDEILRWLDGARASSPQKVFVTHGELEAANSLRDKIQEKFGWNAIVPAFGQSEAL